MFDSYHPLQWNSRSPFSPVAYSWPSLVWPYTEELFSQPLVGENRFWLVLPNCMSAKNAIGCLFFHSHLLFSLGTNLWEGSNWWRRGGVQEHCWQSIRHHWHWPRWLWDKFWSSSSRSWRWSKGWQRGSSSDGKPSSRNRMPSNRCERSSSRCWPYAVCWRPSIRHCWRWLRSSSERGSSHRHCCRSSWCWRMMRCCRRRTLLGFHPWRFQHFLQPPRISIWGEFWASYQMESS